MTAMTTHSAHRCRHRRRCSVIDEDGVRCQNTAEHQVDYAYAKRHFRLAPPRRVQPMRPAVRRCTCD